MAFKHWRGLGISLILMCSLSTSIIPTFGSHLRSAVGLGGKTRASRVQSAAKNVLDKIHKSLEQRRVNHHPPSYSFSIRSYLRKYRNNTHLYRERRSKRTYQNLKGGLQAVISCLTGILCTIALNNQGPQPEIENLVLGSRRTHPSHHLRMSPVTREQSQSFPCPTISPCDHHFASISLFYSRATISLRGYRFASKLRYKHLF